jgi:hypothetical protein
VPLAPPLVPPALPAAPPPPVAPPLPGAPPPPPAPPVPAGPQTDAVQTLGATQSTSLAQLVLHAVVPHAYGLQGAGRTTRQVPPPLHVRAGDADALVQVGMPQIVPPA